MPRTNESFHQQVKADLIKDIQRKPLGSQLPSIRTLSDHYGVAYLTINGVLKELEWEGYVKRVPRKGVFVASRERTVEHDLRTGTSKLKAIVFAYPDFFSYATWIRLHAAEERAVKRRLALIDFKMTPQTNYDGLCDLIRRREDVLGAIVIPIPGSLSAHVMKKFNALGLPVVVLSNVDSVQPTDNIWCVSTDWHRAGYLQAKQLIEAGHEKLALVRHEPQASEREEPLIAGILQAIREADLPASALINVGGAARPWDDSRLAGYELTRDLLVERVATAAIYESLHGLRGGLRALWEAGLSCPEDLAMVSVGRGNGDEEYLVPPVTTVDPQPEEELKIAMRCVLSPTTVEQRVQLVPPVLSPRQSVAPVSPIA